MADEGVVNLNNYKGIYYDDDNEKYTCPETGAHFRFEEMYRILDKIRVARGDPKVDFDALEAAAMAASQDCRRLDTEESQIEIPSENVQDAHAVVFGKRADVGPTQKNKATASAQMTQSKPKEKPKITSDKQQKSHRASQRPSQLINQDGDSHVRQNTEELARNQLQHAIQMHQQQQKNQSKQSVGAGGTRNKQVINNPQVTKESNQQLLSGGLQHHASKMKKGSLGGSAMQHGALQQDKSQYLVKSQSQVDKSSQGSNHHLPTEHAGTDQIVLMASGTLPRRNGSNNSDRFGSKLFCQRQMGTGKPLQNQITNEDASAHRHTEPSATSQHQDGDMLLNRSQENQFSPYDNFKNAQQQHSIIKGQQSNGQVESITQSSQSRRLMTEVIPQRDDFDRSDMNMPTEDLLLASKVKKGTKASGVAGSKQNYLMRNHSGTGIKIHNELSQQLTFKNKFQENQSIAKSSAILKSLAAVQQQSKPVKTKTSQQRSQLTDMSSSQALIQKQIQQQYNMSKKVPSSTSQLSALKQMQKTLSSKQIGSRQNQQSNNSIQQQQMAQMTSPGLNHSNAQHMQNLSKQMQQIGKTEMIYAGQAGPSAKNMAKKNLSNSELRMASLTASQATQPRKQSSKLQSKSNAADIHNDMLAKLMKSTSSNSLGGSKQKSQSNGKSGGTNSRAKGRQNAHLNLASALDLKTSSPLSINHNQSSQLSGNQTQKRPSGTVHQKSTGQKRTFTHTSLMSQMNNPTIKNSGHQKTLSTNQPSSMMKSSSAMQHQMQVNKLPTSTKKRESTKLQGILNSQMRHSKAQMQTQLSGDPNSQSRYLGAQQTTLSPKNTKSKKLM